MEWVPGNPNDRSVRGFRIRHGSSRGPMSKSAYYVMKSQRRGPVEIQVHGVTIITAKAEAAWEKANEKPTGALARLVAREAKARRKKAKAARAAHGTKEENRTASKK